MWATLSTPSNCTWTTSIRRRKLPKLAEKIAGPKLVANTWMEQYQQILNALNMEKIVTTVTIGLIQLVAALNILITLIMMVMEKNRDIAVLMSMGAQARSRSAKSS